jgi:diketogulonate reductase-like aldo/keto reductase
MPERRTPAPTRREVLGALAGLAALPVSAQSPPSTPLTRPIPSSGEALPLVGLGTWITFNVGNDAQLRSESAAVMKAFLDAGGRMIDSSPMYGSAQQVVGDGLKRIDGAARVFSADKVWIGDGAGGPKQIEASRAAWGVPRFDLLQVHNLLAWQAHLATLSQMKKDGRVRYIGITTSEGRRHSEFERIMATQPLDFVQVSYNPLDREVEQRILPLARERRIAVIVNRPFRQGALTDALGARPLPAYAAELNCRTWAQLVLKFIVSHQDVTCAIPATTSVAHVRENLAAASGPMPDAALRKRIASQIEAM